MNRPNLRAVTTYLIFGLVALVAGLYLRAVHTPEWMFVDTTQHPPSLRPWAVEADCYSQLARVQRILQGRGLVQNHFTVENWPEGLVPSTTAPFDYAILLLYFPLWLFTKNPLDWAGALVSPALWISLVLFWSLIRSREFTWLGRAMLLMGSAILPALIWATAFGRPRHVSLIIVLMAMGLTAEYERWQIELTPKRAWNIFAGVIWGLCCWTSLYEPTVVVAALILFNLVVRKREDFLFLVTFGGVMLIALLVEGVHVYVPPPEYQQAFARWWTTIAEVQPVNFNGLIQRFTPGLLTLPLAIWWLWPRKKLGNKVDALVILLTFLLTLLTAWQSRWYYFAALGDLFLVVRFCEAEPAHWARAIVLFIFVTGTIYEDDVQIEGHANGPANQPSLELAQIARAIDGQGGIMAPWWLSPGLLYFSGQPIVSGSSHCGISGIVASARFYTATSWKDAQDILRQRQVRWVVVWDDPRLIYPLLQTSCGILGQAVPTDNDPGDAESTVAQLLIEGRLLPTSFRLCNVTQTRTQILKLYEFTPNER